MNGQQMEFDWDDKSCKSFFERLLILNKEVRDESQKLVENGMIRMAIRSKEIITELRHVVTGNLRGSLKGTAEWKTVDIIEGQVGTNVHYARYVEALPDGGYLFRAVREMQDPVSKDIVRGLSAILAKAGKGK